MKNFLKRPPTNNRRFPTVPVWVALAILLGVIVYACAFKVLDRDFWWHITAGKLMVQTHQLISTDPFAYTRAGQPYIARHEWLAQLVLYCIFAASGISGIIVFRTLVMTTVFGALVWGMGRKHMWPAVALAILAIGVVRPYFVERPQLFTFLIFTAWLLLARHVLKKGWTLKAGALAVVLQILWVNFHGAASLLAGLFMAAIMVQQACQWYRSSPSEKKAAQQLLVRSGYVALAIAIGTFVSPNGFSNVTYLVQLVNDRTVVFIGEWQPRAWGIYLRDLWFFWVLGGIALVVAFRQSRRGPWVFWTLLIGATLYLSRQAVRHELFFVLTILAASYELLLPSTYYARAREWLRVRPNYAIMLCVLVTAWLGFYTWNTYQVFVGRDNLAGYGYFAPAQGAYDFVVHNNLQGHYFNTYGIGGYLMYRGYQTRLVYIDGRNVDYGFVFMSKTYLAGQDAEQWQKLDDQYHFTYAVVDYDAARPEGKPPGISHLDSNPNWRLVYLDDWTAVYTKVLPQNKDVIDHAAYSILTPGLLDAGLLPNGADAKNLEHELQRVVASSPGGTKAYVMLANLYAFEKNFSGAEQQINAALKNQPHRGQVFQALGEIYSAQGRWAETAGAYAQALWWAGDTFPNVNYTALAGVFDRGNKPLLGAYYHVQGWWQALWLPKPIASPSATPVPTPSPSSTPVSVVGATGDDIQNYNEQGIALAQKGQLADARKVFLNALALDPSNAEVLNNLGALEQQAGNIDTALSYYQKAIKQQSNYADAHYNLATVYYRQKKYAVARQEATIAKQQGRDISALDTVLKQVGY